uniref:Uncharacterized protein n=1 Tax=Anopheles atroparvus TaxID=41427 RepID=A0A182ISV6_ANOAO
MMMTERRSDFVLKGGYMVKRSQNKKRFTPVNYKTRWFELTRFYLSYYDIGNLEYWCYQLGLVQYDIDARRTAGVGVGTVGPPSSRRTGCRFFRQRTATENANRVRRSIQRKRPGKGDAGSTERPEKM